MIGILQRPFDRLLGYLGYVRSDTTGLATAATERQFVYTFNDALYDNSVYEPRLRYLSGILVNYCGVPGGVGRIVGHFNPVKEIVEAYQNVLPGVWGKDIRPVKVDDASDLDPSLLAALTAVWQDSNLESDKARIIRLAALHGTIGLRVSRLPNTDRVAVQYDHPARIFNVEEDESGNVVAIVLKYKEPFNRGTRLEPDYEEVEVVEEITRDGFSRTVNGEEKIPDDDRRNTFGFCPYVILRHKDNGTIFGDWAFKGSEPMIHDINWRITQQGRSINRHQFPKWFFTAGGNKPEEIDMGNEEKALYVQTSPDTPPPSAEAIVPMLDQASAMSFTADLRDMMRGRQPELNINDIKLLAGLSGEAYQQASKPAESAILDVRPRYDHAFVRAMQMAVSMRIDLGLSTVTGKATPTGAGATVEPNSTGDAAFHAGLLDFKFADRPALPPTSFQKVQEAQAATAEQSAKFSVAKSATGIVDQQEQLKIAGYSPKDIAAILERKRASGVLPAEPNQGL
jgi:hypothetical protein